jgi:hypothetical protein
MEKIIDVLGKLLGNALVAPYVISFLGLGVAGLAVYLALTVVRQRGGPKG